MSVLCCQLLVLLQQQQGSLSSFRRHSMWLNTQAAAACRLLPALPSADAQRLQQLTAPATREHIYASVECSCRFVLLYM
jgi:hypothetical protein